MYRGKIVDFVKSFKTRMSMKIMNITLCFYSCTVPLKYFNQSTFSVSVRFMGDYVGLRRNPQWKDVLTKNSLHKMDRYVVFADIVNKINRSNGKVGKLRETNPTNKYE